jgi:hypothetical protein
MKMKLTFKYYRSYFLTFLFINIAAASAFTLYLFVNTMLSITILYAIAFLLIIYSYYKSDFTFFIHAGHFEIKYIDFFAATKRIKTSDISDIYILSHNLGTTHYYRLCIQSGQASGKKSTVILNLGWKNRFRKMLAEIERTTNMDIEIRDRSK